MRTGWPAGSRHPSNATTRADRWAALHPGARTVRGWLHDGITGVTHRFAAHSVIRTAELVDMTLPSTESARPFIAHPREIRRFFTVLCRASLDHPAHKLKIEFAALAGALQANRDFSPDEQVDGDCL